MRGPNFRESTVSGTPGVRLDSFRPAVEALLMMLERNMTKKISDKSKMGNLYPMSLFWFFLSIIFFLTIFASKDIFKKVGLTLVE